MANDVEFKSTFFWLWSDHLIVLELVNANNYQINHYARLFSVTLF